MAASDAATVPSASRPRLQAADLRGVFVLMPTPAVADGWRADCTDSLDLDEARRGVSQLIDDGADGIMLNGTVGECATLTNDEWYRFTEAAVEAARSRVPVVAGATTLNTRDTIDRARFAREVGASGILLGRPFWNALTDGETLDFYRAVAEAVPELGIIVYNNPSAFKNRVSVDLWRELAAVPQIVGAKYGVLDDAYADAVAAVGDRCRLMLLERDWLAAHRLVPDHAVAAWSIGACCDPFVTTELRRSVLDGDDSTAEFITGRLQDLYRHMIPGGDWSRFRTYSIQIEKTRVNAGGYLAGGPCRHPYTELPDDIRACGEDAGRMWTELAGELRDRASV